MNRFKTTPSSLSNKQQQIQSRSSNTSLSQSSPKSAEKLGKPTVSTFMNNNVEMVSNASTGSAVGGRPNSSDTSKAKPPATNSGQQQQKRPNTPVTNNKNTPAASPTTTTTTAGSPAPPPQKVTTGPPSPQQQQKKPTLAAPALTQQSPNPSPTPQKQPTQNQQAAPTGQQKSSTGPIAQATSSTTSIKSNGNSKTKTTSGNSNQQNKPMPQATTNNNNSNSGAGAPRQGGQMNNSVVFQRQSTKTFPVPVSQQRYPSNISRSMVSLERSRNFRAFIEKAMGDKKVFSCCGVYPAIRNALKKRGWVEKPGPLAYSRSANASLSQNGRVPEDESDVAWMTRVMKDYPPDFIWVIRRDNIDWKSLSKEQLINRFPKAWFTTKVGLAACLQHMHWFSEAGVSDTFFPRCYRLCLEEERQAFQDDYRLTACMSYLRYFVDTFETKGHAALADVHSKITPLSVDFASRQLGNYIRMRRHEDIDWLLPPNFMTQHWDAFIHQYYAVVHERKRLRFDSPEAVHVKYETAKKMLHKVAQYWPQIELDGKYNMWICKPGARSRGKGIVIMNTLERIMDLMSQSNFRECNWVVQKYIEKPMLIYKTKFDIRQWFLITDWTPLTVWFYKESYVRFCTKPFVLEDFHESIHLCNNAIQCRYQNSEQRDSNLPDENMWSSDTFQAYLKTIGRLDAWPLIYSGMKQAIVGVLLASQETVENKRGCYELYGADFMLTEDFRPWLIEINSCPCMAPSTSVTARMCAQCLEDTVKVAIDRKNNRNADTGQFEMIYRQNAGSVAVQQFSGHDLTIIGKKLTRDIDWPMTMSKSVTNVHPRKVSHPALPQQSHSSNNNRQTLSELLQKLRVRNQEMFQGALASQQTNMDRIFEGTSAGNTDTAGSLLNKMRSLKSTNNVSQDHDIMAGMKKVYPSHDPKQSKQVSSGTGANFEKPSASGKGEDPSPISSKFTDMNSLAYLMRNSHNVGKDEIKAKRSEEKKASSSSPTSQAEDLSLKPTPKTLAEVKAMVEATSRQHNSEKYGKIQSDNNNTIGISIFHNKICDSENDHAKKGEVGVGLLRLPNRTIDSDFENNSVEKQADTSDNCSDEGTNNNNNTIGTTEQITECDTTESREDLDTPEIPKEDNSEDDNIDNNNYSEPIRRTKSLQFASHHSLHSWASNNEDCLFLKQLSSKHSFNNKRVESQTYMIYPLPAHPSHEHLPCKGYESTATATPSNTATIPNQDINQEIHPTTNQDDVSETLPAKSDLIVDCQPQVQGLNSNHDATRSEEELPLIDLITSDTTVLAQLQKARENELPATETIDEAEDPQGKLYQSILFPVSSLSSSDSDNDFNNDDNNNEINMSSTFIPSTFGSRPRPIKSSLAATVVNGQSKYGESSLKPKPQRYYNKRRNSTPSNRRCSRRFPCYRVMLEPQSCPVNSKRKTAATLPMKTVNLLLPPNCNHYY